MPSAVRLRVPRWSMSTATEETSDDQTGAARAGEVRQRVGFGIGRLSPGTGHRDLDGAAVGSGTVLGRHQEAATELARGSVRGGGQVRLRARCGFEGGPEWFGRPVGRFGASAGGQDEDGEHGAANAHIADCRRLTGDPSVPTATRRIRGSREGPGGTSRPPPRCDPAFGESPRRNP